jgi:hypothetical protein
MNPTVNDQPDEYGETQEPEPEAMDFPTLANSVAADLEALLAHARIVNDDLGPLTIEPAPASAVPVVQSAHEAAWSPNELLAQLNGIAALAYRIARCVHPLIEARTRHIDAGAGRSAGRR